MLNKIGFYFLMFSSSLFINHSSNAVKYVSAVESPAEDISAIRRNMTLSPLFPIDSTSRQGKIIIFIKDPDYIEQELGAIPDEFAIQGNLPKGIISQTKGIKQQYLEYIFNASNSSNSEAEYIFTGLHNGGRIALLLAFLWQKEYKMKYQKDPAINQIKVITFFAPILEYTEPYETICKKLGELNIIDFSSYLSSESKFGVPIAYLPDEQLFDRSPFSSYKDLIIEGLETLGYSYAAYYLYTSIAFFGIETVKDPIAIIYSYLIYKKAVQCCRLFGIVPSEDLILKAFRYTQENYRTNQQSSLKEIGIPPLISSRRGIGSWLRWLVIRG